MKRPTIITAVVLGAALFLSACEISVTPTPPPPPRSPDATVNANVDPGSSLATLQIQPGRDALVQINNVQQAVSASNPLLYVELDQGLELRVLTANRNLHASSRSAAFFARGTAGLAATGLESQAILTQVQCRGSCVILRPGSDDRYFALIRNDSGSVQNVQLYAFSDVSVDVFETANDRPNTAPNLPVGSELDESGAIETLGDVDYWYVQFSGDVTFTAPNASALGLNAVVTNVSEAELSRRYVPGETFRVNAGEYLRVWSTNDRAAASAASAYFLTGP